MNNKVYLISPDDVKAASQINYNVDDGQVANAIRTSQNVYLREIIGDDLLESLQEKVSGGTIDSTGNTAYLELLDNYVGPFLTYKANVEICLPISLKIRNIGVAQGSDTNINAAQLDSIRELADYYQTQAADKANRLVDFLLQNSESFPELDSCVCICGKQAPNLKKHANTQLWLGLGI